eukprot:TRINITY_DN9010_c0_g2_i2.p1 TRINITY_DN9010_c0_g2~~TRINITY_DN9010_c0_g2_i2.p1  ORF type:complete len:304 (+),score=54.16 TRINITY_DN9010_c0_g2_i2:119-1030(+)
MFAFVGDAWVICFGVGVPYGLGNISSIYYEDRILTDSYWDEYAAIIPILPAGPIAFLGLAGGTAVRTIRKLFPHVQVEGWEIDEVVVDLAKDLLGLQEVEAPSPEGGSLLVHVADALADTALPDAKFAGLFVDLFAGGAVLPELQEAATWHKFRKKLCEGGRILVNCGGVSKGQPTAGQSSAADHSSARQPTEAEREGGVQRPEGEGGSAGGPPPAPRPLAPPYLATLEALLQAFPGEVMVKSVDANCLALTGPFPFRDPSNEEALLAWEDALPWDLAGGTVDWVPFHSGQTPEFPSYLSRHI